MTEVTGVTTAQIDQVGDDYAYLLEQELDVVARYLARLYTQDPTEDSLLAARVLWQGHIDKRLAPTLALLLHTGAAGVRSQLRTALTAAAVRMADVPPVPAHLVDAYLATATNRLAGAGDLLWEAARDQLREGVAAGESHAKLARRIRKATGLALPRAKVIARNEAREALLAGADNQVRATGLTGTKRWVAVRRSTRTRLSHRHAHGQEVDLRDAFTVGGVPLDRPHDPTGPPEETIGCRCGIAYSLDTADVLLGPAPERAPADDRLLRQVWKNGMVRAGVTVEGLARLLEDLGLTAAAPEVFHLAGKHNQKTHNPRHRAQAKAEAGRLIGSATKNEPAITADLQGLVGEHGAELIGLNHRLKTEASLERKISSDMVAAPADVTPREVAGKIGDTVRYTTAFPPDRYAGGVQAMQGALVARGYTQVKHKNTWSPDSPYRGINQQWNSPDGQRFELQFHTPDSFALKSGLQHRLYEEYRLPKTTPARRQQLDVQMKANARALPMPPGALDVGPAGAVRPRSAGAVAGPERLKRAGLLGGDLDQVVLRLPGQQAVAAVGVPAPVGRKALDDPVGRGSEQRQRPLGGEFGRVGDGEVPHNGTSFQTHFTTIPQGLSGVADEAFHLPGKHNQKSHGHRKSAGAPGPKATPSDGKGSGGGGGGTVGGTAYDDPAAAKKFLDDHYGTWKKNDLTDAEYAGLSFYQSPGFALMNGQLRGLSKGDIKADMTFGDSDLKRARKASGDLTKGIAKAPPLPHAVQVHRGFDAGQFGDLSAGMTVTDKGFTSTSLTSSGVASVGRAGKPGVMRIELPAGTKAGAGSARELILPPGSSFQVVGVRDEGGTTFVDARLIGGG